MVENKGNGTYEIKISLEEGALDLSNDRSVCGDFTIEVFEKNFGTFKEDISTRENFNVEDLFVDNKKVNWEKLDLSSKTKIEILV
jgi:hypothetical protein